MNHPAWIDAIRKPRIAHRQRALAAAALALAWCAAPVQAATITKVIDFTYNGSFISDFPQISGTVQLTVQEGLNYTGPGSKVANGEITIDSLQVWLQVSAAAAVTLVSDDPADIVRIQYTAQEGRLLTLSLSSFSSSAVRGDFQVRFRSLTDILTGELLTSSYNQSFQTCGQSAGIYYILPGSYQACHGGSLFVSDPVTTVVPVPAALPLMASGLLALAGLARVRRPG